MWRVYGGAAMVIAGIAAFIESSTHRAIEGRGYPSLEPSHLSRSAYDLLRIGAWALVILGVLTIAVGLIGYWQRTRRAA